jgi:hypothetical protein
MRRVGIHLNSIDTTCSGEFPCAVVHDNTRILAQHVDADNAGIVAEFVKGLFQGNVPIDTTETALERMFHTVAFQCPELHIDIYQPCTAKSCAFYSPNQWARNCILCYRVDHTRDMLDNKELSFLLDKSLGDVRAGIAHAIGEARTCALAARLEKEEKEPEVEGEEATVPTELDIIRSNFHLSPQRVLKIACDTFATVKSAAQALNVSPDRFKSLCSFFRLSTAHLN